MENELLEVKKRIKANRHKARNTPVINKKSTSFNFNRNISKLFVTVILMLITMILLKSNTDLRTTFYKYVFDSNISFAAINKLYQDNFGSPIPFQNVFKTKTEPVFNEKLKYSEKSKYKDGVKLLVGEKYLVPVLETGIVIFVGEKEGYGNTVIIQQKDGVDVWYSNITNLNAQLYDYIEQGSLLGEVKDNCLYLVYVKDGKPLDYENYL